MGEGLEGFLVVSSPARQVWWSTYSTVLNPVLRDFAEALCVFVDKQA